MYAGLSAAIGYAAATGYATDISTVIQGLEAYNIGLTLLYYRALSLTLIVGS